jgi:hypothetical protein
MFIGGGGGYLTLHQYLYKFGSNCFFNGEFLKNDLFEMKFKEITRKKKSTQKNDLNMLEV